MNPNSAKGEESGKKSEIPSHGSVPKWLEDITE